MILNVIFAGVALMFLGMSLATLFQLRWVRRLPVQSDPVTGDPAFCSVVLAARNEENRIQKTIQHLLGQSGVRLEIIVVDDRSTDRTREILLRLAAENDHIRVVCIETLPENWIGKCHACHQGASIARGEWILFTDADCWIAPDVIARALAAARREQADHITLTPGFALESLTTRAWYVLFLVSIVGWISGVNRGRPKAHLGIGAFNLVQAAAYRKCGGYEALRLSVVDDVKLGLLLSRCDFRTRAYLGAADVECHWGTTLREMIRVMEKNYFAVLDYRLELVVAGTLFAILAFGAPIAGLILFTPLGIVAALSPFAMIAPAAKIAARMEWRWQPAIAVPLLMPVFLYAMLNSTAVTLRQGGVRWRETFYPLQQLRAGGVRR